MTKREFEITDMEQILSILDESKLLHLGLSDDGQPYVVPMNYGYVYQEGKLTLYLHGATSGYKYEVMEKNPKVSFTMETRVIPFEGDVACQYGTSYFCVMGKGTAAIVEDVEEKKLGMSILMKTQTGKEFHFHDRLVSAVHIIRIDVAEFTAKHRPIPPLARVEKQYEQYKKQEG